MKKRRRCAKRSLFSTFCSHFYFSVLCFRDFWSSALTQRRRTWSLTTRLNPPSLRVSASFCVYPPPSRSFTYVHHPCITTLIIRNLIHNQATAPTFPSDSSFSSLVTRNLFKRRKHPFVCLFVCLWDLFSKDKVTFL